MNKLFSTDDKLTVTDFINYLTDGKSKPFILTSDEWIPGIVVVQNRHSYSERFLDGINSLDVVKSLKGIGESDNAAIMLVGSIISKGLEEDFDDQALEDISDKTIEEVSDTSSPGEYILYINKSEVSLYKII